MHSASVPAIVLIAAPEHLPALRHRDDLRDAIVFTDTEALRALDVITRQRPHVVAMERLFAGTTRGLALINRIKADPALDAAHDAAHDVEPARVPAVAARVLTETAPPAPATAQIVDVPASLDAAGTRKDPRVEIADGVEILLDGNPVALIDLSTSGAQVLSPAVLKPNQRLRVSLPDPARPARMAGTVTWASFEMPKGGPRYRAGIEFAGADAAAIARFCEAHKKK